MAETTECVAIHDTEAKCDFYLKTESCHSSEGLLDYMYFIFCYLQSQYSWGGVVLCMMWLCMLFIGLGVTADDFLCPSLVVITKTLHLSQNIAGVTFLAFGNGAPDIFSSVAGTEQNRPELVIGTLFGAGIFVTSVVAGSIIASKPFKVMERPFLRDIIFYVCAAFWIFLRFFYGEVTLWHSIGFVCLYVLYILVVIISRIIYNRYKSKKTTEVPAIEIEAPTEPKADVQPKALAKKKLSVTFDAVTFEPTGEDNPEAAGVVLRRFSFRGSISMSKKRHSSVHSHHEHVIKALTKSVECHTNPAFANGHLPPPLDSQISKNSLSSLLSSTGELTMIREFIMHIFPIDTEAWPDKKWAFRIFDIIKAPVYFLLILTIPVVDYENNKNNWCRPLNIIHIFLSPIFVMFALGKYNRSIDNFPVWAIILIISFVVAVTVFCTSTNDNPPVYHCFYGYVGFATSVVWVYLLASEIVSLLQTIGIIFRLSDTILGLTVLAWGNSIGDFISNLSVARQGYPRMGISACYGGPLLNLLLGIGIPYTVVIVKYGHPLTLKYDKLITLLYGSLTTILLTTIVTMTILRFQAKRNFGILLICMYLTFLTAAIILETGII